MNVVEAAGQSHQLATLDTACQQMDDALPALLPLLQLPPLLHLPATGLARPGLSLPSSWLCCWCLCLRSQRCLVTVNLTGHVATQPCRRLAVQVERGVSQPATIGSAILHQVRPAAAAAMHMCREH